MESADVQRGGGSLRRSPFDLIMNQIRRKRAASDRKPLGRFLSRDRTGIPEDREDREERGAAEGAESECDAGWGRVCVFLQRLGKKADSRSLNLAHCDLTATDLLELATLLQFLPQLEEMDVSWNGLIGGSLKALTSYLQDAGGVRALRLCSCRLDAEDLAALGEALGCVPLLEILDLSWNSGLGGGALQGLLGKLPPPLKELHLVSCQLNAADATLLGGLLSVLSGLCVLDVSCNPQLSQEVEAFREFSSSLSHAASITTLRLQACGLTEDGLHALGGSLHGLPSLRQLDLSCNRGLSGGLSHLTLHLSHLTHLQSLDLHLCCHTHTDLQALIQALPSLPALTELDVSSNKEVGGALHPLLAALPLTQMRRLPLNSCSLSQEAFTALAVCVPYLRSVDVSWCKVVGGHLPLLLDALQPAVLTELRLSSCELTTEDLQHLAAVCRRGLLSSLLVLDLSYNASVGDEGWSALFAAGGLGSLQEVDLSLRPLTSAPCTAWLPALLCALPPLPALTRLSLQCWTSSPRDRKQLKHCLRKRSVLLEWDPPNEDETSSFKSTNQESPEE
ncbi:leucine-rich repeat-containing protein 31 isoform X2 [Trematomus bernacchii]|uniref:leucine-rich repeat-containing protein 31 isoform X1 n=1 Tax=Trematomus bernacchii TaxID=40690 RepID=UPI00146BE2D7|nr:leucine-rich repeat-containing protein 31 isoform X1 [Trematomus bernacchii]XP_034000887.1 leucine-rich repeat-containing protein 31 isoform X2 [Trematomus bernacchii]